MYREANMYYRISLNLLAQLGLMLHPGWFHQHHTTPSLFTERASETLDMYFFCTNLEMDCISASGVQMQQLV